MKYAQKSFLGYFGQNLEKINKFFLVIPFMYRYKKTIKNQKFCLTFQKICFLTGRLTDPIESYQVARKKIATDLESRHLN